MAEEQPELQTDAFVLEYSPSQRAWHIQHIEDLIQSNLLSYLDQSEARDYVLLGVARTHDELLQLQEEIENTFKKIHPEEEKTAESLTPKRSFLGWIKKIFGTRS
jgi:hypothetical protein